MGEILFLCHRIPFPPDRGDKIRSHHFLKKLTQLAPVHVATFADDALDMDEEANLAAAAASYLLVNRSKPLVLAGIEALARRRPVSLTAFHDKALARYVADLLASRPISTIYLFSGQMGQYIPKAFAGRVIADFVDVDSAKFEAYAAQKGAMGWIHGREARLLRQEEARIAAQADVSLLTTQAEADLFTARLPAGQKSDVRAVGNGIDSVTFDPAIVEAEPAMLAIAGPRLIFTGQMDYAPNIAAARRVIEHILPLIRQAFPGASFHVVGRNPAEELLRLSGKDGCHIWGRVDDIRGWLKAADLALIPLDIARGVQNKVLEAMAMALPVVLSTGAATGIDAADGQHFAIADSDEALAAKAIELLCDKDAASAMGRAARRRVVEHASWHAVLALLGELVDPATPKPARDAA